MPETTVRRLLKTPAPVTVILELAAVVKGVISTETLVTVRKVAAEDGQRVTVAAWSGRPSATAAVTELSGRRLKRAA